jgi:hypothetical protein
MDWSIKCMYFEMSWHGCLEKSEIVIDKFTSWDPWVACCNNEKKNQLLQKIQPDSMETGGVVV